MRQRRPVRFIPPLFRRILSLCVIVSPLPGRGANAGSEVLIQGKQIKAVTDLLAERGIPKKWVEAVDLTEKKK